jgi:(R,R)-butanediol dehydrogenase/meso-butanediol dehydrogenase/diacetyl reductase
MKAARWYGQGDLRICEVREPQPAEGEVKIEVKWCGICGSDMEMYEKGPIIPVEAPLTVGHEFSGEVVEIGEGVSGFVGGERVVVDPYVTCGRCFWCKNKEGGSLCRELSVIGYTSDGGFAKYVSVPAKQVHKIGRLSYEVAALTQPTVLGVHIAKRARLKSDENALVIGAGPVGLATIQAAKALGARVISVDLSGMRREFARKMGADLVLNPKVSDVREEVLKQTEGIGVDVAFECVGREATMETAVELTRRGGRIVAVGFSGNPFPLTVNQLITAKQSIIGMLGYEDEFSQAISILEETEERTRELITAKIELDEIIEKGYNELINNKDKHIKILVSPVASF